MQKLFQVKFKKKKTGSYPAEELKLWKSSETKWNAGVVQIQCLSTTLFFSAISNTISWLTWWKRINIQFIRIPLKDTQTANTVAFNPHSTPGVDVLSLLAWLRVCWLAWIADDLSSDWGSAGATGKSRVVVPSSQERDLTVAKDYVLWG